MLRAPAVATRESLVGPYELGAYTKLYAKNRFQGTAGISAGSRNPIIIKANGTGLDIEVMSLDGSGKIVDQLHVDREPEADHIRIRRVDALGRKQVLGSRKRTKYFGDR